MNDPCYAVTDLRGVRANRISPADVADFLLAQAKCPGVIGQAPLLISER